MKDNKFYTGYTADLRKRIERHNLGKVKATKYRKPFKLVYSEHYATRLEAINRERYLKTWSGRIWLNNKIEMVSVAQLG